MNEMRPSVIGGGRWMAVVMLAASTVCGSTSTWASIQSLDDGTRQNGSGDWELPNTGFCAEDPNQATRPDCLALRFPTYTNFSTCSQTGTRAWSFGVCNDPAQTSQAGCEAIPGRKWSHGICAVTMQGHDRNKAVCTVQLGGTWITAGACVGAWIMPDATTYNPPIITGNVSTYPKDPGPGDQCLRCHNSATEWNAFRGMDVESFLQHGHKAHVVSCARCHDSAVEDGGDGSCSVANLFTQSACVAAGGSWTWGLPYPAPLGRSSHHGDLTFADGLGGGYCTDTRLRFSNPAPSNRPSYLAKHQCEYLGGTWYAQCSDPVWPTQAQCQATAGCSNPAYTTSATCTTNGQCSIPFYALEAACTAGGGVWSFPNTWASKIPGTWSASSCSIGTCSNSAYTTQPACVANGGTWTDTWTDQFNCQDAGGTWTGFKRRRGQLMTALCLQCHRQEAGGVPADNTNPGTALKVGPVQGSLGFISDPIGNQFLNSPHAQFTGTFAEIGTATLGAGYSGRPLLEGDTADTTNGCTTCHNAHKSVANATNLAASVKTCQECHAGRYAIDLTQINHRAGVGTPLERMATDPTASCVVCHMPDGMHLFRINSSDAYTTFPAGALTGTVNAATSPDGAYAKAVWVDIDRACGQCHGGGTGHASTTGSITSGSKVVAVAAGTGANFAAGDRVAIAGAGVSGGQSADLETYVTAVTGDTVTLVGPASRTVSNAAVVKNPTKNNIPYLSRATLAPVAKTMHTYAWVPCQITFTTKATGLTVDVTALITCSSDTGFTYDWDWGETPPVAHGTGATTSHTYPVGGTYAITLTLKLNSPNLYNTTIGSVTRSLRVTPLDLPPVPAGVCTWTESAWTMTVLDQSTDTDATGVQTVIVNWGDGSTHSVGGPGALFSHVYFQPGSFPVSLTAIDSLPQAGAPFFCPSPATPTYFTISGTVYKADGTTPIASAFMQLRQGSTFLRTTYTALNGTFSFSSLKPGTYTLTVTKSGYTFANPAATITLGPSSTGNSIKALLPAAGASGTSKASKNH